MGEDEIAEVEAVVTKANEIKDMDFIVEEAEILDKKAWKKLRKAERKAEKKAQRENGQLNKKGQKYTTNGKKANKNRPQGSKEQQSILTEFFSLLQGNLADIFDENHIDIRGEKVYFVPERDYENRGIHFLRNGVYLGDLKKNRFEPSEPFALILSQDTYKNCLNFEQDDERLKAYLHGDTLQVDDIVSKKEADGESVKNGWYLVLVDGYPLGFGKLAGTLLKNKYPVGWRQNTWEQKCPSNTLRLW